MSELPDFLLARIAEDESRVDNIGEWRCTDSVRGEGWGSRDDCRICGAYSFDGTEDVTEQAAWDHLESVHRRTRVLVECEAKRRIVGLHEEYGDACNSAAISWRDHNSWPCETIRALALPYADHPDYRPEWRP